MKNNVPSLSIVTPTYNRGNLIKNCFKSLLEQSSYDFEWIVVDDGSKDNTKEVMTKIIDEKVPFHIQYVWKENGGKHTALNVSHSYIRGKYVLILDSDDRLTHDAVENILLEWKQYENSFEIGIVTFLKKNMNGQICAYAKDENVPTDVLRYKRVCVTSGDCCEVIRTKLFKKYSFPVFAGERFLAETALWYRVGLEASCIYINKPIYICDYLEGGLTKLGKKLRINNPKGGMYTSYLRMHKRCRIEERMKAGLLYVCYGCFAKLSTKVMMKEAKPYRIMVGICLIPGKIIYFIWKKKYLVD